MEGGSSPIIERRANVSLKEKVESLETKFLGMRQSIVEDIKMDLRGELREGTQNIGEYDSEALITFHSFLVLIFVLQLSRYFSGTFQVLFRYLPRLTKFTKVPQT